MTKPLPTGWNTFLDTEGRVVMREYVPEEGHDGFDCEKCEPWWAMACSDCEGESEDCWKCGGKGYTDWTKWGGTLHLIHRDDE